MFIDGRSMATHACKFPTFEIVKCKCMHALHDRVLPNKERADSPAECQYGDTTHHTRDEVEGDQVSVDALI